ncbi:hypothetical protein CY34DRAFT_620677 [Suillus luteus UH-Slu-Lm8-n1]|uniref:Uncharacterized protein n=1 Tax=Suillus luteus UH-Slu-Lm8-n1 TaxID=930992 RepID=A0A0D0A992_9AGAM|nr:hypothetical protein CY34DRAFT_620677 [Suillus luteus UH-Slu-Lm8-n1]
MFQHRIFLIDGKVHCTQYIVQQMQGPGDHRYRSALNVVTLDLMHRFPPPKSSVSSYVPSSCARSSGYNVVTGMRNI